ncbi:TonB-linked SusC/RagA family outer membrane protein [Lutibacter sp. Hel_I_33_5]|uniref:SusC/RagA family TonB-linked outer membrane protein n=1 Tax=Lutibacter sp. Hel_I_33_5 TaxID=1566289 RepID=UPI0011A54A6A|nr:TonB-dependent receptor [Lutibacter sp. Hel_I_33_5]TVZ54958.1 TonB-linked SusC/RagA family outer membrane protein [Lutibacter sp. Hel_I_33_5]
MKKKISLIKQFVGICMLFFISASMYGQSAISGTVTSSEDNQPIPSVNVIVKGTTNGTSTDFDGKYTINASAGDVLVFSFLGYKTSEKIVGNSTTINVVLDTDSAQLDEIVVIGYGTARKTDLTGSISSISSKDFERQPITRAEDALQSRTAGVSVTRNSGAPGGDIKIRVRGSNSITGNNAPLIVIDGIIGGDLSSLNANDIQSFNVLKDASATAIYGSRGANGVVMVTTKKGRSGKPKVNVNNFISISKVPNKINLLSPSQFATSAGTTVSNGGADYQDEYFKTGITNNVQVSASGNEGSLNYYLSGNLVDQDGIVLNTGYKRYSLRSNLNADITDKLSVGLNVYGSREDSHNLVRGGAGASSDTRGGIVNVLSFNPALSVRDSNGDYNLAGGGKGSILVNPIAVQNERDGNLIEDRTNANLNLSYDISDNLNLTTLLGSSTTHFNNEIFEGIPAGSNSNAKSRATFNSIRTYDYQLSNILTWNKDFGENNLKLTGVYEMQTSTIKNANINSIDFAISGLSNAFYHLEIGKPSVGANENKTSIESFVARAELSFGENLYLTGTVRRDESSKFREGNRVGYFPSISAKYNLGEFISEDSFLNDVSLRAGYGVTGNQDIPANSTYPGVTRNDFFFSGTSFNVGAGASAIVDPNITWETTKQINIGADFSLLENRINVSVDWYKKNTTDLLLDLNVPQSNGGGIFRTNLGEVENTGFDLSLSANVVDRRDFNWNSNLTFSSVSNKVINLGGANQLLSRPAGINPGGAGANLYINKVGEPLGGFYGYTYTGVAANGDAQYDAAGQSQIGNGLPDFNWGLNNTLTYKNLDLNILVRGVHGYDILNATRGIISLGGGDVKNATHADSILPGSPTGGTNHINSSRYIEDGSFIRLSNISLGYNFSDVKWLSSLKFFASAQNLLTITDYTGYDPEVSSTGASTSDTTPSLDFGALPNPRTFTFGVNIGL